jgi:hypothetical protein
LVRPAPPFDPRSRGASQRTLRQIVQSSGEPSQGRRARALRSGRYRQPDNRCAAVRRAMLRPAPCWTSLYHPMPRGRHQFKIRLQPGCIFVHRSRARVGVVGSAQGISCHAAYSRRVFFSLRLVSRRSDLTVVKGRNSASQACGYKAPTRSGARSADAPLPIRHQSLTTCQTPLNPSPVISPGF